MASAVNRLLNSLNQMESMTRSLFIWVVLPFFVEVSTGALIGFIWPYVVTSNMILICTGMLLATIMFRRMRSALTSYEATGNSIVELMLVLFHWMTFLTTYATFSYLRTIFYLPTTNDITHRMFILV